MRYRVVEAYHRTAGGALLLSVYVDPDPRTDHKIRKRGNDIAVLYRTEFRRFQGGTGQRDARARGTPRIARAQLLCGLERIQARSLERRVDALPCERTTPAAPRARGNAVALQFEMGPVGDGLHHEIPAPLDEGGQRPAPHPPPSNSCNLFPPQPTPVSPTCV